MEAATGSQKDYATLRAAVSRRDTRNLTEIPGVGPSIAADLYLLGIRQVADLKDRDPEQLYQRHMRQVGQHVDRCVLYTFRCAVYYASNRTHDPELLKWWNWKDR
jgi:Holliday junction resolvasome RuvABC DNA-binding subunit